MLKIRPAAREDASTIVDLITALAIYEREPLAVTATEADILRDGFGATPKFRCVIAEWDGLAAGFALWFYNYSTWQGRPGLYLEDLFVKPEFRGKGIGKALLLFLAKVASDENCGRFEWSVLDWNIPAIEFYESLGAKLHREWLRMRVEGEALSELAKVKQ
jgi:GNAT superfamily N-acetyltransferase